MTAAKSLTSKIRVFLTMPQLASVMIHVFATFGALYGVCPTSRQTI